MTRTSTASEVKDRPRKPTVLATQKVRNAGVRSGSAIVGVAPGQQRAGPEDPAEG